MPFAPAPPRIGSRPRVAPRAAGSVTAFVAAVLLGAALGAGCNSEADTALIVRSGVAGAAGGASESIQATWTYRSSSVSIDATLVTTHDSAGCATTGRLLVDKFAARADRYALTPTACSDLEVTTSGDLVLYSSPTGHDWTKEGLKVDTSRELLSLGPWAPSSDAIPVGFQLSAPSCGGGCECARFVRVSGDEQLMLELGRRCE